MSITLQSSRHVHIDVLQVRLRQNSIKEHKDQCSLTSHWRTLKCTARR
jgi:hypothetical protein